MAVYKASECYPFLSSIDMRVGKTIEGAYHTVQIVPLSCKVNTSNKDVTGYRVVLMNEAGEEIFANKDDNGDYIISPISELPKYGAYATNEYFPIEDEDVNMGYNGSYIKIPFIQAKSDGNYYRILSSYNCIYYDDDDGKWYDVSDAEIQGLVNSGESYKWVIYLYQGDGVQSEGDAPYDISYDNLDSSWYDQTLFEGTILGSTGDRIQIAPTQDVVLYQRFLQLGYISDGNFTSVGGRAPITTYDSYYGHIYPQEGYYSKNIFKEQATEDGKWACQVYKHSNDPDYIDAGDMVDYIINDNITNFPNCGLKIGAINLSEGTSVLVTGQTDLRQNGVWIAHENAAWTRSGAYDTWGDFIGKVVYATAGNGGQKNYQSQAKAGGTLSLYKAAQRRLEVNEFSNTNSGTFYEGDENDNARIELREGEIWGVVGNSILIYNRANANQNGIYTIQENARVAKRPDSYKDWSSYLGLVIKKIGVSEFFASNAQAGGHIDITDLIFTSVTGYNYWTDGSNLIFTEEKPISLYPKGVDGSLAEPINISCYTGTEGEPTSNIIDNYVMKAQEKVLTQAAIYVWDGEEFDGGTALTAGTKYYIENGTQYGNKYFEVRSTGTGLEVGLTLAVTTADVNLNSTTYTYLSPFVGIEDHQKIFFKNGKTATTTGGTVSNLTIEVSNLTIKEVDTKLWRVQFCETLSKPLDSVDPYKYELRTFFKGSDENQFSAYNTGYIDLGINTEDDGEVEAEEETINNTLYFFTKEGELWYSAFVDKVQKIITNYRYIPMLFKYEQDSNLSWSYYQMVLTSKEGVIIQDTGKVYSGSREERFFGLNADDGGEYYVVCIAQDTTGKLYSTIAKVVVNEEATAEPTAFEVEFDCEQQAIKLKFYAFGFLWPEKHLGTAVTPFESTDNSLQYIEPSALGSTGQMAISGANGSFDAEIQNADDLPEGLVVFETIEQSTSSEAVQTGITYGQSFGSDEQSITGKEKIRLISSGGDNDGYSVCFETTLDANFCGPIWKGDINFQISGTSGKVDVIGSIELRIPDIYKSSVGEEPSVVGELSPSNLNEDRTHLQINISGKVGDGDSVSKTFYALGDDGSEYPFILFHDGYPQEWYLHPNRTSNLAQEYVHANKFTRNGKEYKFCAFKSKDGKLYNGHSFEVWDDAYDMGEDYNYIGNSLYRTVTEQDEWVEDSEDPLDRWNDNEESIISEDNELVAKKRHSDLTERTCKFNIRFKPDLFISLSSERESTWAYKEKVDGNMIVNEFSVDSNVLFAFEFSQI